MKDHKIHKIDSPQMRKAPYSIMYSLGRTLMITWPDHLIYVCLASITCSISVHALEGLIHFTDPHRITNYWRFLSFITDLHYFKNWRIWVLIPVPPACKAGALPFELIPQLDSWLFELTSYNNVLIKEAVLNIRITVFLLLSNVWFHLCIIMTLMFMKFLKIPDV